MEFIKNITMMEIFLWNVIILIINGNIIMKCNYINNKMNGFFKKYYDNGELEIESNYN